MDCFLLEVFDSRGSSDQQVEINLSADALRLLLQQTDVNRVIDKKGNTALHRLSVYPRELPTPVYVLAQQGALVNKQNDEGETPLHAAVRADNYLVTEALLHCGADSTITNKIGTSVLDLCRGSMKELVRKFNPPLHQAVSAGNFAMVCKLLRNWVSVTSICVGSSESVLDWAKTWHTEEVFVLRCLQKISEHKNQSVLIHSLLANDTTAVRKVLEETKMRSVNSRYKEMSLLSIALENKNKQLLQLLLDHGVKTNCRVQHRLSGVSGDCYVSSSVRLLFTIILKFV
ncbi:hypothetical protein EB796_019843 [Bugula neritina]|uniref:ANKFY1 n=1 Tax=Bugula neritina TaxID=10212 RepID=A0A7J7J860_BUGNE|nr:hypothetical protein EB796_019843 [Bugula neritina]